MAAVSDLNWQPLQLLDQRFRENVSALAGADPALAARLAELNPLAPFFIAARGDEMYLGRPGTDGIEVVPNALSPATALNWTTRLFPSGNLAWPLVLGGLSYGWLWDRIARLPCKSDTAPGYRPPIYFLTGHIERLWAVLHVMQWQRILPDPRFHFIVGPDAVAQLRQRLIDDPTLPRPKAAVRIEQDLWREDFDAMTKSVEAQTSAKVADMTARLLAAYPRLSPDAWSHKLRSGGLRVMGITSRYTTFLQHSMRDWLAAFERLGHQTQLLIEPADHVILGQYGFARGVLDYRPDLVVMIDHYRAELGSLPESLPCVMWVQDRLSNIYSAAGGANQKENDYCLGFGRLHLSSRYGYPAGRFMSCPVGINEQRLAGCAPADADLRRFACDVSYVSHATVPADQIIREYAAHSGSPQVARLCDDIHQRLEAWYAGGGDALGEVGLHDLLDQSMRTTRIELRPADITEFLVFLSQRVNNAIFRHQTLHWLAGMDIDLRLWGRGWENHPTLKRFARGEADNQSELPLIYRASKINLQVTPFGAVHQRLLDGLAAGGFFLLRYHPADAMGAAYRRLWEWCCRHNIQSDAEMYARADDQSRLLIGQINALLGYDPSRRDMPLYDCLRTLADEDFVTLANANWPDEYPQVAFGNQTSLRQKVTRYLTDANERNRLTLAMKQAVIEKCSYLSISRRLLKFMNDGICPAAAADLERPCTARAA